MGQATEVASILWVLIYQLTLSKVRCRAHGSIGGTKMKQGARWLGGDPPQLLPLPPPLLLCSWLRRGGWGPSTSHQWHLYRRTWGGKVIVDMNKLIIKSIIQHLLEVRESKPGKNVQLQENGIRGLCLKSQKLFQSAYPTRIWSTTQTMW